MLEAAGIGPLDERIYLHLCGHPALPVEEIATALDLPPEPVEAALDRLRADSLIYESDEKLHRFVALDPELAMDALVLRRRQALEQMRETMREQTALLRQPFDTTTIDRVVHAVPDHSGLSSWASGLQRNAQREVIVVLGSEASSAACLHDDALEALGRGVLRRSVYLQSELSPADISALELRLTAGELARVAPEVPFTVLIADRETALLPLTSPSGPAGVVLRETALVSALVSAAEALWQQAIPLPSTTAAHEPSPLTTPDFRLLALLAAGQKDEVIARQLNVSTRTVLRRLDNVMKQLGATTRFQAGLQAARRGLVG